MRFPKWTAAIPVLALAASAAISKPGNGIQWTTDYKAALALAKKTRKPVLLEFYADWCGPCKQMAETTFKDPEVVKLSSRFHPVRIDVDKHTAIARKYQATSIPLVVIVNPSGKTTREALGFRDAQEFALFMKQGME
jgi:thiol:disulfide interchange protein